MARNSVFHFSSLAVPALAALVFVPITVRALGPTRFGLLALAWAVGEGAGVFDLGLSRATVRFVADALARRSDRLRQIVSLSVLLQIATSVVAGTALLALAPFLATRVFSIPAAAIAEAREMFRVLAVNVPVIVAMGATRAVLEGGQRFDIAAAVRIPGSIASVLIPAVAALAGASLPSILWLLLASRIAVVAASAVAISRVLPDFRWEVPRDRRCLGELLGYSGWVAVSTFLGPALGGLDRFALGSIRGVTALGYYGGAVEAASRFLLLPVTAFGTLLPALATTDSLGGSGRALTVARAARRQLAAASLPLALLLLLLAPQLLTLWLGAPFATFAADALRILSVGVFLTGLAHLPLALLYGSGRPDIPAKVHLVQVAVHIPVTVLLVRALGINGAALAWAFRASQDFFLYEWASRRALGSPERDRDETERFRVLIPLGAGLAAVLLGAGAVYETSGSVGGVTTIAALVAYAYLAWRYVLRPTERLAWSAAFGGFIPRFRTSARAS